LLQVLEVGGCIVTIDAIGCQTEIAQAGHPSGLDPCRGHSGRLPGQL